VHIRGGVVRHQRADQIGAYLCAPGLGSGRLGWLGTAPGDGLRSARV